MVVVYGTKKGELDSKKKAELVALLADKVTSEDNNTTPWLHHAHWGERMRQLKWLQIAGAYTIIIKYVEKIFFHFATISY